MNAPEISFTEAGGVARLNEPVTTGVPFPRGRLASGDGLVLRDGAGQARPLQTEVLDRWPDGSCKWLLVDFQATVPAHGTSRYSLEIAGGKSPAALGSKILIEDRADAVRIDTGAATFLVDKIDFRPLRQVVVGGVEMLASGAPGMALTDDQGNVRQPKIAACRVETAGPLRATLCFDGVFSDTDRALPPLEFFSRLHFFSGHSLFALEFTIRNPRAAKHPGGLWDLGDPGSIYFKDLSERLELQGDGAAVYWSAEPSLPLEQAGSPSVEIYQDSSGGENWQSRNHVNRFGKVAHQFKGYRVRAGAGSRAGGRAAPTVVLACGERRVAAAVRSFWQNFPKALEADGSSLTVRLFPGRSADLFELQGGEQKTHSAYFHFSRSGESGNPLAWSHAPLVPRLAPEWHAESGVFPYFIPEAADPNRDYVDLIHRAIEGENNFFARRETIDEYGWRNFGELYADHEAFYYRGEPPVISHYNNQYDGIYGFALHYARSGDARWFELMRDLARHVVDIDIYHTAEDKPAYSGGLFWHTDHYSDAATSTHRTFSVRTMKEKGLQQYGGGPSNEHCYTTGLMTWYFLTGDRQAREAVLGLAEWVIRMDDGNATVFRFVHRGATGLASQTASRDYHGPGRGAGNSVNALLDAHRLGRDRRYLAKADELVRRCVHPADDIDALNLLDAEHRWSYLAFLQALGKYLDCKTEWETRDAMFDYARESLLRYARWMLEHEAPYSQAMDRVEYPTETWVVHDLRKSSILEHAARYTDGKERERFLEKAAFFYRNCLADLAPYATKTCTRPLVLLLHYGAMHGYFVARGGSLPAFQRAAARDFGARRPFRAQRSIVERRLKIFGAIAALLLVLSSLAVLGGYGAGKTIFNFQSTKLR